MDSIHLSHQDTKHTKPPMPPKAQTFLNTVAPAFNLLGGTAGALAIGLVIWRGGAIERQVEIDTGRIQAIESSGSPGLAAHVKMDDERVSDLARRLTMAEDSTRQAMDLKVEIRVLGTKLDAVVERLKSIENNAAVVKLKP